MNNFSQTHKNTLRSKLQRLSKRVGIKEVDGVFDEILEQIAELGSVSCRLADDSSLCLEANGETVAVVKVDRAKSVLRVMCARLSVRCSEWANRPVSPYGEHVEFELPLNQLSCKVDFENTPDEHRFVISGDRARRTLPAGRKPKDTARK
jgi:hypothetical protein